MAGTILTGLVYSHPVASPAPEESLYGILPRRSSNWTCGSGSLGYQPDEAAHHAGYRGGANRPVSCPRDRGHAPD